VLLRPPSPCPVFASRTARAGPRCFARGTLPRSAPGARRPRVRVFAFFALFLAVFLLTSPAFVPIIQKSPGRFFSRFLRDLPLFSFWEESAMFALQVLFCCLMLVPFFALLCSLFVSPVWLSLFSRRRPFCCRCVFALWCRCAAPGCSCLYRDRGFLRRLPALPPRAASAGPRPRCVECFSFEDCEGSREFVPRCCLPFYRRLPPE
jgi:hypothetical protein